MPWHCARRPVTAERVVDLNPLAAESDQPRARRRQPLMPAPIASRAASGFQIDDTSAVNWPDRAQCQAWAKELEQFAKIEPIPKEEEGKIVGADGKPYTGPGAALYRYAIQTRTYYEDSGGGRTVRARPRSTTRG